MKTILSLTLICVLFTGCSALEAALTPNTTTFSMQIPPVINMRGANNIAFDKFSGTAAVDLREELQEALIGSGFTISDQSQLKTLLKQAEMAESSGVIDPSTAPEIGQAKSFGVIIRARVARHEYSEKMNTKEWKAEDGTPQKTNIRIGTAQVEVNFEVVDLATATIINSRKIDKEGYQDEKADNKNPKKIDKKAVLRGTRSMVISEFLKDISPRTTKETLKLQADNENDLLKQGIKSTRSRNLSAAESTFRQVLNEEPYNDKAVFNLGVVSLLRHDFDNAISLFQKANQMNPLSTYASYIQKAKSYKNYHLKMKKWYGR